MQKYSIINELRERNAEAVDDVISAAFSEYLKPDDDGVDLCEKSAGYKDVGDMRAQLCVAKYRSLNEWAQQFCLEVFDQYISSEGEKTGCYESDIACRGCAIRNISCACFFNKMFEEYDDICKELYELQMTE